MFEQFNFMFETNDIILIAQTFRCRISVYPLNILITSPEYSAIKVVHQFTNEKTKQSKIIFYEYAKIHNLNCNRKTRRKEQVVLH